MPHAYPVSYHDIKYNSWYKLNKQKSADNNCTKQSDHLTYRERYNHHNSTLVSSRYCETSALLQTSFDVQANICFQLQWVFVSVIAAAAKVCLTCMICVNANLTVHGRYILPRLQQHRLLFFYSAAVIVLVNWNTLLVIKHFLWVVVRNKYYISSIDWSNYTKLPYLILKILEFFVIYSRIMKL